MSNKKQKLEHFIYDSVPDINFFIYPPMQPVLNGSTQSLEHQLELNTPLKDNTLFTVYISVPYCRKRCHSCCCFRGFLPEGIDKEQFTNEYLECLIEQIKAYASTPRYSSGQCGAIYIGGGTASVLSPKQVKRLINTLRNSFNLLTDIEINFEGNPLDFSMEEYLEALKNFGITRLSIGYQSCIDSTLEALNTAHRSQKAFESVENAMKIGFRTVNVDLLYNVPGQTQEQWQYDLQTLIDLAPQSISPGDYVVFSGSKAEQLIDSGELAKQHSMETAYEWYLWGCDLLERYGYNEQVRGIFALPDHIQQYVLLSCNRSCEIVGIGAGAYSFINGYQFTNTTQSELFKKEILNKKKFQVSSLSQKATKHNLMERYIIHNFYSALLNRSDFKQRFAYDPLEVYPEIFSKLETHNLITIEDNIVALTKLGKKWRKNVYYEFHSNDFKD
jgi:oxygen-independent coproporphyrinogen III oxidase